MKPPRDSVTSRRDQLSPPQTAEPYSLLLQPCTRPSSGPHRSLTVVPLIGDKRYYGEAPVGPRWGYGGMSGLEETLFWQVEAAKVLQLQQVRRKPSVTHERITKRAGVGTLRVGMVPNRSRDRNIP